MPRSSKKTKQKSKPKEDKQVIDGLDMSFEDAMKVLAKPKPDDKKSV